MAMSQGGEGRGAIFTEINITPLTDIFLVLLIIMMVIAPMMNNSKAEIKMPTIQSGQGVEDQKVVVEITKEGQFFANGSPVSPDGLESSLGEILRATGEKNIVVRADQSTQNQQVMKVFEAAGRAGFEKLTVAGEPLSGERQQTLTEQSAAAE